MPAFAYRATDAAGRRVEGVIEAADAAAVASRLQELRFFPLSVRPAAGRGAEAGGGRMTRGGGRRLVASTRQLAVLVGSGIPLDHALAVAGDVADDDALREVVAAVHRSVQEGAGFADALARHPRVFSELYVSMVRAGCWGRERSVGDYCCI